MDLFTFISSLVKSLAWPVTIVILTLLFRARLGEILDRLIEFKFYRVSLKLSGAAENLKNARRELPPPQVDLYQLTERNLPSPVTSPKRIRDQQEIFQLDASETTKAVSSDNASNLDPSVVFEVSWGAIESELLTKARSFGGKRLRKAESAAQYLVHLNALPTGFERAFAQVRAVYVAAKRHPNVPIESDLAKEFKRTCDQLRLYLDQIGS